MREQILKLKKSQLFADKLTLIFATIVMIVIIATTTFMTAYAADEDDKESPLTGINFTIAHLSELCSDAYSSMIAEAGVDFKDTLTTIDDVSSVGIIGNAFGPSSSVSSAIDKTTGGAEQGADNASNTYSLNGLLYNYVSSGASNTDVKNSTSIQYMLLGMGMSELGLDEVRTADTGVNTGIRTITGYITYILYILAYTASSIMTEILKLLKNLNFFGIFLGNQYVGDSVRQSDIYQTLTSIQFVKDVQNWYDMISDGLRFVIIGFMVLFLVGSMTVFKSKQMGIAATNQIRIRNFIYRLVVMFIGVPLAGMVYSEALLFTEGSLASNSSSLGDYILCQFVDFEGYVSGNRPFSFLKFDIAYEGDKGINVYLPNTYSYDSTTNEYDSTGTEYDPVLFGYRMNWLTCSLYSRRIGLPGQGITVDQGVLTYTAGSPHDCNKAKPRSKINLYDDMTGANNAYESVFGDASYFVLESGRKYEFDFCRKLILAYAQGDVITPSNVVKIHYDTDKLELFKKVESVVGSSDYEIYINAAADAAKKILNDESISFVWSKVKNYDRSDEYSTYYEILKDKCYIKQIGLAMFPNNVLDVSGGGAFNNASNKGLYITASNNGTPASSEAIFYRTLGHKTMVSGDSNGIKQRYAYAAGKVAVVPNKIVLGDTGNSMSNVRLAYTYNMSYMGLSPLSVYNYLNSVFTDTGIRIQDPKRTTNSGVAIQHYSVTTPYSGLNELIHLAYTMSFLLALGVIGWVFGISLLMNTVVQGIKMIPSIFKMMIGSLTGFVEACTIGLSIVIEILVTMLFYTIALDVVDFMVQVVRVIVKTVLSLIVNNANVQVAIANVVGVAAILWTIYQLIRWRQAITISLKSIITHTFNQVFGTNAKMSTGANGGLLGMAAAGAAAAVGLHALAGEEGGLAGVVDDLAGAGDGALADTLNGMKDDLANGDFDSALDKYGEAKDQMMRGKNSDDEAAKGLGAGLDDTNSALTGAQQEEIAALVGEGKFDEALAKQKEFEEQNIADMAKKAGKEGAKGRGTSAQAYNENMLTNAQQEEVDKTREEKGDEAADALQDEYMSQNMADEAANNPDAEFDSEGLTSDDYDELDKIAAKGAESGKSQEAINKDIEDAKKEMRKKNAADYQKQQQRYAGLTQPEIDDVKNRELTGDEEGADALAASYREKHAAEDFENNVANEPLNDNGLTNEQQMEYESLGPGSEEAENYAEQCRAENAENKVDESGLTSAQRSKYASMGGDSNPEAKAYADKCRAENMANKTYEAGGPLDVDYSSGITSSAWADMAQHYDANGLTTDQQKVVARMVRNGASEEDVAKSIDSFAQQNFGDNYQEVRDSMNKAADRSSSVAYGDINNADGDARVMSVGSVKNADGSAGYNIGTSQARIDSAGNVAYDTNGNMLTESSNASFSVREANGVTTYTNNVTGASSSLVDPSSAAGRGSGNYAAQYNANMAEQATGQFHSSGGTVTQLGTDSNGARYEARETASGTQLLRTDANGTQSVVTGTEANHTLMAFGYQASAGTTTSVSSGGKAFTITETNGGPVVRNDAGQQVYGESANQVIQNSGYKVANQAHLQRQPNGVTTRITSGNYNGYTITDVGQGAMVFDTSGHRVQGETAANVIKDSGYVSFQHRGSDISHTAGRKFENARVNSQASMVSANSYAGGNVGGNYGGNTGGNAGGGNVVANEQVTIMNTAKGSWKQALENRQQAYTKAYDPVTNPEGYMGVVGGHKVYSENATHSSNTGGYRPMVKDISVNDEAVKYHDDGGNNIATILLARSAFRGAINSGEEVDPRAGETGGNNPQA